MDPQDYTPADRYKEEVAFNLPDLSEVSAAAFAFIKAIRKLESSELVRSVDPVERISEIVAEVITEALNYDEDDNHPLYKRLEVDREVDAERIKWIKALDQQHVDALLKAPTINLGCMVQNILGVKS